MKRFAFILLLFPALLMAQPGNPDANGTTTAGPPDWVTGSASGDGEITSQLAYIYNLVTGNTTTASIINKSYFFSSYGIGAGTYYKAGYFDAPATDANLTQAGTTVAYGTANNAYAAHGFVVCSGAGSVDAGTVGLRVTGTSITDAGVRTANDADTIITDITAVSADQYIEAKKFIGTTTYELIATSGSPTTYSFDFNYGFIKYEDFGNIDFTATDFEMVGRAGANDTDFAVTLYKHSDIGWSYSAAAFTHGWTTICDLGTDHSTEDNIANGVDFAYKRAGLSTEVTGSMEEGIIIEIVTGANNSVQYADIHFAGTRD